MKSRIAVYEGYAVPFAGRTGRRPAKRRLGGPIFDNPRLSRYADLRTLPAGYGYSSLGRRGYTVPAERGYGPLREGKRAYPLVRKGYKVKRMKDTPAMKRAQKRFKKAAKFCSRTAKGKGKFQSCMRRKLKKSKR